MDLTSGVMWVVLIIVVAALGFAASWFSVRTLRSLTCVMVVILAIAVTRFGFTHPEYRSTNLIDSFMSGVDQVVIALLRPFWPGRVPAPGVGGRWVVAVAILLGYRQLEGLALSRQAPELDLSAIGDRRPVVNIHDHLVRWPSHGHHGGPTARERSLELAAELRFRLPTMEILSPSILPGGTRSNAIASIAEASGVTGAGMVGAVFRFAGMFWPRPRSFRVRGWVESDEGTRITVLMEDVKTGLPIATQTVAGCNFNEAASMVAGYIARQIFAMDRSVPKWCYGMADGRDLGAMQLVRLERFYAACEEEVRESRRLQIRILSGETGAPRTAGIVRYELAQLLALDDQHLESLRLHALNRELHPRFYRGRYRLAMSLEMIASLEHYLPFDALTLRKLAETVEIISRYRDKDGKLQKNANDLREIANCLVAPWPAVGAPCRRVPQELTLELLEIAARDLREVRTQLSLRRVLWDAFFRRDERAVWLPHWKRRHRRSFQDGVCVAELLVAIRCRLREPVGMHPGWLNQARKRWHLRMAIMITWCVAGDPSVIYSVLADPHGEWWEQETSESWLDRQFRAWVRWLPRQRNSASWQAAYNTACLYAALADAARRGCAPQHILRDLEGRVIASLRRMVDNPDSELERAWDWVAGDPDFRVMRDDHDKFKAFDEFLNELKHEEYPASTLGKCAHPHMNAARNRAVAERWPASADPPIFSPVPNAVPEGDGERAYVPIQVAYLTPGA